MAREFLLHSGEFVTKYDYKYKVEFYKVYDIHAFPSTMTFDVMGGTSQVTIWSTKGSAVLSDPPSWLDYRQIHSEQIPGTRWYRYTYLITCDENQTGSVRTHEWSVGIEDGEGTGIATCSFTVNQSAGGSTGDLSVEPGIINFDYRSGTQQVSVYYIGGTSIQSSVTYENPGDDWVDVSQSYWGSSQDIYDISVTPNPGEARSATVTFSGTYGTATVTIYQGMNPDTDNN